MNQRAVVIGCGHYLPARVVENAEFEATLDTNDEWIKSRSGIERRHFAAEGETTSHLATAAAKAAIADAGLHADDVDAIIVATSTPDLTFPSAATMVQAQLGMTRGFAFDGGTNSAERDAQHLKKMRFFIRDKPKNGVGDNPDQEKDQRFRPDKRQNDPHGQDHQISDRETQILGWPRKAEEKGGSFRHRFK